MARVHRQVLVVVLLVASGCGDKQRAECVKTADCREGERCFDGRCARPCAASEDCGPTEYCDRGVCLAVFSPLCDADAACTTPTACQLADGARCIAGECRYENRSAGDSCDDDNPCTTGETCDASGQCVGEDVLCVEPPMSVCADNDGTLVLYDTPGSCDPLTGECIYPEIREACAGCTASCLVCSTNGECGLDRYCDTTGRCAVVRDDGNRCDADDACSSGYCGGGLCCADGDCCNLPTDCPAEIYEGPATCTTPGPTTNCQGTRKAGASCVDHQCEPRVASDDSGCAGEAFACPDNLAPIVCTADVDQSAPICPGACSSDADCTPGMTCSGTSCVASTVEVLPVYPSLASWTDWVKNDDPTQPPWAQLGTPCSPTDAGSGYDACFHGGELRSVSLSNAVSCDGLNISDELGAFSWTCDDSEGTVTFYTTGLAPGTGLATLVSFATSAQFATNRVQIVNADEVEVARSLTAVWQWRNVFEEATTNNYDPVVLDTPYRIYFVADSKTLNGFNLNADHVSLLVADGVTLRYYGDCGDNCGDDSEASATGSRCLLAAGGQSFLWLEGGLIDMDYSGSCIAEYGVSLSNVAFSRVHRMTLEDGVFNGIYLGGNSDNNSFTNVVVRSFDDDAILNEPDTGSMQFNQFRHIRTEQNYRAGIRLRGPAMTHVLLEDVVSVYDYATSRTNCIILSAPQTRAYDIGAHACRTSALGFQAPEGILVGAKVSNSVGAGISVELGAEANATLVGILAVNNGQEGIRALAGRTSTIAQVTSANNETGLRLGGTGSDPAARCTVANALLVNSANHGLVIDGNAGNDHHRVHDLAALKAHGDGGEAVFTQLQNNAFTGVLLVDRATNNCMSETGSGLYDATCTDTGAEGSSSYFDEVSTATLHINVDPTSIFVGPIGVNDTVNTGDNAGTDIFSYTNDWDGFENDWRAWGKDGSFPTVSVAGACSSGTCRIWDWRLAAGDDGVRGFFGGPTAEGNCPAAVHGDTAIANEATHLYDPTLNAEEISGDALGDDDGICEDAERCRDLFLPRAIERALDGVGDDDGLCESGEVCLYAGSFGVYQGEGTLVPCGFQDGAVHGVTMLVYPSDGA